MLEACFEEAQAGVTWGVYTYSGSQTWGVYTYSGSQTCVSIDSLGIENLVPYPSTL